jgi:hypothetical protein
MKMKIILIGFVFCFCGKVFAQDFEVPSPYVFKKAEDYKQYEKDIIAAEKWLEATPFNEQVEKRKEVSAFVMKWIAGSPTVYVMVNKEATDLCEKNPNLLMIFMAACSRYVLENNYSTDVKGKYKFAIERMIEVYKNNKGVEKDKRMDKLVKAQDSGKLDQWLKDNMNLEK